MLLCCFCNLLVFSVEVEITSNPKENSLLSQFFISLSPKVLANIIEPIITVQYQKDWDDGSTSSNNEGVGCEASLNG
jgi:hypothetical protein